MDHLTSGWREAHCFSGDVNFDMFPKKNMGKKLPNEVWARPVASKLSERRPLTLHGKWAKTVLFRIFANYSNAKFSGDIRGCHT